MVRAPHSQSQLPEGRLALSGDLSLSRPVPENADVPPNFLSVPPSAYDVARSCRSSCPRSVSLARAQRSTCPPPRNRLERRRCPRSVSRRSRGISCRATRRRSNRPTRDVIALQVRGARITLDGTAVRPARTSFGVADRRDGRPGASRYAQGCPSGRRADLCRRPCRWRRGSTVQSDPKS